MSKTKWIILAGLLLAIPLACLGLRALPEESPPLGPAPAPPRSVSAAPSATPGPRASAVKEAVPQEGAEQEGVPDELTLEGPGPCIELVVTAQGAPVVNAKVAAGRYDEKGEFVGWTSLPVGPEGRRQAWCKRGTYLLVALAPGLAPKKLRLPVSEGSTPLARFELDAGHTLRGRVLDKDSEQPITAAQLILTPPYEDIVERDFGMGVPKLSITSDAKGLFRADALAPGTYELDVEAPGHTRTKMEIAVPRSESLSIELEDTSRLEGTVIDSAGAPVPGAKISAIAFSRDSSTESQEPTDAQGRFSLEVAAATYQLEATAGNQSGQLEGNVTVAPGGLVDGLVIRVQPTGSLVGKLFAKASQKPIEAAFLSVQHNHLGTTDTAVTDAKGSFRVDRLLPGTYSLKASRLDYQEIHRGDLLIQGGQETSVELAMVRLATVKGLVTDAHGRPAKAAPLFVKRSSAPGSGMGHVSAYTNLTGHYQIGNLPAGSYRVEARLTLEGKPVVREVTLDEGGEAQADFTLPDVLCEVEGSVKRASGGPPTHPVEVEVTNDGPPFVTTKVDDTGHFTFRLLPGSYTFKANYSGTQDAGPAVRVTVEPNRVSQVSLTIPDTVTETSGVVLNARGEPVPLAFVCLKDGEALDVDGSTDAQGRFSLRTPLNSAGKPASLRVESGPQEGEVQGLRLGSQGVVVRLRKPGALLGRISAVRGPPVQGFTLNAVRREGGISPLVRLEPRPFTGDTFELVDLPTGMFDLRVHTVDGRSGTAEVRVTPGQMVSVEVSVGRLGSVKGRVVNGSSGAPIESLVHVDRWTPGLQWQHTDREGRFQFFALEPGAHEIEVGMGKISFQVREGETLDLGDVDPAKLRKAP